MAQYDVYSNPFGDGYLLNIQTDLLDHLNTRVVIPLLPVANAHKEAGALSPRFEVDQHSCVLATQLIATIPASCLKTPVSNIENKFAEITGALDFLFQGF